MLFARRVFFIAGLYGLLVLLPQYFMEEKTGFDFPPPITHPEYFYGFLGVAVAWQVAFLVIAHEPYRFRPLMLVAIVEKLSFFLAVSVLFIQGRVAAMMFGAALIDGVFAVLFFLSFRRTGAGPGQAAEP